MMLHQDASRHVWLDGPALDLVVTMDDATGEIYSAFLVEEEGTDSTFLALMEVFGRHGLPLSLYTDRGSHYFYTAEAGGKVARGGPTQVGVRGASGCQAYCPFAPGARPLGAIVPDLAGSPAEGAGSAGITRSRKPTRGSGTLIAGAQRALRDEG